VGAGNVIVPPVTVRVLFCATSGDAKAKSANAIVALVLTPRRVHRRARIPAT